MPTIKDVAKEARVSVTTVSRVLNNSPQVSRTTVNVVTTAMEVLGYRPNAVARALVSKSTNTMGIMVGDVSDPFFGTLIKSVDDIARANGKHILVGNGYHNSSDERRALEILINSGCEAIVVHSKDLSDDELIKYAKEVQGMVLINRHIPQISSRCIYLDNKKGAYLATEHLIRQGHSKIACIASSVKIEDTNARLEGYKSALADHGIELAPNYIEFAEPNSDGGEAAMIKLLSQSLDISAVVAYNDYMAAGALMTLNLNGIDVPNKVSVIGFDDGLIAQYIKPGLTTIHYPIEMMAEEAARLALRLSRRELTKNEATIYCPTLITRHSVSSRLMTPP